MIDIKVYSSGNIPNPIFDDVSFLLHDSFSERRSQGINFKCGTFSAKDVENEFVGLGGHLFIALDNERVIGTVSLINRRKGKFTYASHDNLAVMSSYKGKGIASALFREVLRVAVENGLDFITSYTATNADSSVSYHLKMGFYIWSKSFGEEYNSYGFIYPLKCFKLLRIKPIRILIYGIKTSLGYIKRIKRKLI